MNINDVYREICDTPHDDEPRLRFADLIEPSDGDWARFIRIQIDATRRNRLGDNVGTPRQNKASRQQLHRALVSHDEWFVPLQWAGMRRETQ